MLMILNAIPMIVIATVRDPREYTTTLVSVVQAPLMASESARLELVPVLVVSMLKMLGVEARKIPSVTPSSTTFAIEEFVESVSSTLPGQFRWESG